MSKNNPDQPKKACPFCNSDNLGLGSTNLAPYVKGPNGESMIWFVQCNYCNAHGPISWDPSEAVEYWDTRAEDQPKNGTPRHPE